MKHPLESLNIVLILNVHLLHILVKYLVLIGKMLVKKYLIQQQYLMNP